MLQLSLFLIRGCSTAASAQYCGVVREQLTLPLLQLIGAGGSDDISDERIDCEFSNAKPHGSLHRNCSLAASKFFSEFILVPVDKRYTFKAKELGHTQLLSPILIRHF